MASVNSQAYTQIQYTLYNNLKVFVDIIWVCVCVSQLIDLIALKYIDILSAHAGECTKVSFWL